MTAAWWVGSGIVLVVVSAGFLALWVLDARRADRVAADPARVSSRRRRRFRLRRRNPNQARGPVS